MLRYIIKRLILMFATVFIITTITFFLMHSIPGGPFSSDRVLPVEVEEAINEKYNLNDPLYIQYFDYLKSIAKFDFGPSFKYQSISVNELIASGLPVSAKLGLSASILIIVGVPLGIYAALKRNSLADRTILILTTIGRVVPSFVFATIMLYFFSIKNNWLPTFGLNTWKSYIMPIIAIAIASLASVSRLTRSCMLDVLDQDYIRTARSKGLKESRIIIVHTLRNAMIPVVTQLAYIITALLTGSFVIERIFAIPGIGRHFVDTISNRDYTAIMGLTILVAIIMVVTTFTIDMLYMLIDPRIKLHKDN